MADGRVSPCIFPSTSTNNIAIIFCYFETVMRSFTVREKTAEVDRMKAMVPMIRECGFNSEFVDYFMGHAVCFLRNLPSFSKRAILTYLFNAEHTRAMNIVIWFKVRLPLPLQQHVIANSSWQLVIFSYIQRHATRYGLEPGSLTTRWCKRRIETVTAKLDSMAIGAFADCVANPAGISVELLVIPPPRQKPLIFPFTATDDAGEPLPKAPMIHLMSRV
jgi:hypothetical protein